MHSLVTMHSSHFSQSSTIQYPQFGRVGKDEFTMDLQHPISPFQAFAVTLSSFDSKIACD